MAIKFVKKMSLNMLKSKVLFESQIQVNFDQFCPYEHLYLRDYES